MVYGLNPFCQATNPQWVHGYTPTPPPEPVVYSREKRDEYRIQLAEHEARIRALTDCAEELDKRRFTRGVAAEIRRWIECTEGNLDVTRRYLDEQLTAEIRECGT